MMDGRHIPYSIFISVALLLFCQASLNGSSNSPSQSPSSDDNDAIRSLVSTLYGAYPTKDIEKWTECWSAKAPGFAERKLAQLKFFADYDRIEVTNLNFGKIEVAENHASV